MPTLSEKIQSLRLNALLGAKLAEFWQENINVHGEAKATEFYRHIGLNHVESKGYDFEGLTLSREPNEHEKLCVKGIATAQETEKEKVNKILLDLREGLISDGLKGISKLDPADYHTLVLQVPAGIREDLRDRLIKTHKHGRMLVAQELNRSKAVSDEDEDEFDELDTLTDTTVSRVANDVQSRITGSAARYVVAGLSGAALLSAVVQDIQAGSVSYIDRTSTGAANRTLGIGRIDEMERRSDDIDHYEQSEILDSNTCGPCAEDDGKIANDPNDLPGAPNPACEGGDYCRGFIVAITL